MMGDREKNELEIQWAFHRWTKEYPRHAWALYSDAATRDKFAHLFITINRGHFTDHEMEQLWQLATQLESAHAR